MATNNLQKVDSFQYPAAHLGHLTEGQAKALEDFKALSAKEGYYRPADGAAPASHDDETMLRYLRARKFIPKDAFGQFKDTEIWRKENHIDELYEKITIKDYEETRALYPQWTGRRDRRGIPVYLFEVAPLNSKAISAYEQSTAKSKPPVAFNKDKVPLKMLRLFALYENLTTFIMPLCSSIKARQHPETPISQSNNIVDISKVGLKQFWYLKNHMQDASTLSTAHYPETLDRIFIIGAPAFFPTVWGWIKRWFDPITVSKIFILGAHEVKPVLEKYIDPENIPKQYGGKLEFAFGSKPVLEPEIEELINWVNPAKHEGRNIFPDGPIKWVQEGDRLQAVAVGVDEAGQQRRDVIATLPPGTTFRPTNTLNRPPTQDDLAAFKAESGVSTQPVDDGTPYDDTPPADLSNDSTPVTSPKIPPVAPAALNPAHPDTDHITKEMESARLGTSETRYAQQGVTLADGQMAGETPAINHHGHGDKTVTMEPTTVGQAAKDVGQPLRDHADNFNQPGYLEQAKGAVASVAATASSAAATAAGAVGLGGKKEEVKEEEKEVVKDPRVEKLDQPALEEIQRSQVSSAH